MDFGIFDEVNNIDGLTPAEVYDAHLGQVTLAEELGYHSYWFAEHHFNDHRMAPSPNLLLAAAAQHTSKILLGNMVNVLPFHNPLRLAEECAMLDHLTAGRLQVGIGRGVQPGEFKGYSVDMANSREMFQESYALLKQAWTEGGTAEGSNWRFEDVTLMPQVRQRPHPPVWFTGLSRESAEWAGAQGLPFASAFLSVEESEELGNVYRDCYQPSEQWPTPLYAVMRHIYVSESMQAAREEVGAIYDRLFHQWLNVALTSNKGVPDSYASYPSRHARLGAMNLQELLAEKIIFFGGPDDVSAGLDDLRSRGVDMFFLWFSPQGVHPDLAEKCLRQFANEVMPQFQ
jgi:luciferase family oxidoreductase group 1